MFPAARESLFWKSNHGKDPKLIKFYEEDIVYWKRPQQITNYYDQRSQKLPSLWGKNGIQPYNIGGVGALGDEWLLGTFSAIAEGEDGARIKRIFRNREYSSGGLFQFKFTVSGLD